MNSTSKIYIVSIDTLKPHPFAEKIYQVKDTPSLKRSIIKNGLIEPILIDKHNRILSGRRRWIVCKELGWTEIQVKIIDNLTEQQLEQLIINANLQRKKTKLEILNEVEHILDILGKNQGQRRDLLGKDGDKETFGKIGKDRFEIAAEWIGKDLSAASIRRLMHIRDFERDYPDNNLGLVDKVMNDELPIDRAKKLAALFVTRLKERDNIPPIEITPADKTKSGNYTIYNKSSLNMVEIPDCIIAMVMSSFPYYDVRKYGLGAKTELGLENTYQEYIANMVEFLKEIYRVLSPIGSFFLNMGDTYSKNENYLISSRLVIAACDQAGFHCVSEIIWNKTNSLPQTTNRRLQPSYEKIFHLVKDPDKYYYQPFKIADTKKNLELYKIVRRNKKGGFDNAEYALTNPYNKFKNFIDQQKFEDIIISASAVADSAKLHDLDPSVDHPAIFPSSICVLPILTTTKPGDLVLDPFSGSGSVGETCLLLGRKYIGYEIEERFSALSIKRLDGVEKNINPNDMALIQDLVKPTKTIDATGLADRAEKAA